MFLHALTRDERIVVVGLVKHLTSSDGVDHDAERRVLRALEAEAGVLGTDCPALEPSSRVLAPLRSRRAKISTLLELLAAAYSDGEYHPREHDVVQRTSNELGVSQTELAQLENWVLRQMALAVEADRFLSGGD